MIEKNILITGGSGFIGSSIIELLNGRLGQEYKIHSPSSQELDLLDSKSTELYFLKANIPFEFVIHCAGKVPSKWDEQKSTILKDNLLMFENLISAFERKRLLEGEDNIITKLINLSSGAVKNKRKNIMSVASNLREDAIVPKDNYGLAKFIIEKRAEMIWYCGTLRLFGVFGPREKDTRFIKNNIKRYIERQPIEINQDCKYNFFSVYDLGEVVIDILTCENSYHDYLNGLIMNVGYENYTTLTDVANIINTLDTYKVPIKVNKPGWGNSYYSDNSLFNRTILSYKNIKQYGLENSIRKMFKEMKNE
jgi:nucleoside-diphosphate-sugar epimerase